MLGRVLSTLLGAVCCLAAPPALGQTGGSPTSEPHAPRLRFTPLLGVAIPSGKTHEKLALSDAIPTALTMGADVAWGPVLPFDVGLFAVANLGLGTPDSCPQPSEKCTLAASGQFALRARYTFLATQRISPWVAVGGGIDLLQTTGESTETDSDIFTSRTSVTKRQSMYFGPLFLALVGADYRLKSKLSLGALAGLAMAGYTSQHDSVEVDGDRETSSSGTLAPYRHQWLYLAAYATFDVGL